MNEFNDFFNSIASKIDTKIIKTDSKFCETLKNANEKSLFFNLTTKEEFEDHLKFLKESKAIGTNSIPTKIFKNFKKIISQPLAELLDLVFHNSSFLDECKIAKIILLVIQQQENN